MQVVFVSPDLFHIIESLDLFVELLGNSSLLLLNVLLESEVMGSLLLLNILSDHVNIDLSFIDSHRNSDFSLCVLI